jgi:hypothetical protein
MSNKRSIPLPLPIPVASAAQVALPTPILVSRGETNDQLSEIERHLLESGKLDLNYIVDSLYKKIKSLRNEIAIMRTNHDQYEIENNINLHRYRWLNAPKALTYLQTKYSFSAKSSDNLLKGLRESPFSFVYETGFFIPSESDLMVQNKFDEFYSTLENALDNAFIVTVLPGTHPDVDKLNVEQKNTLDRLRIDLRSIILDPLYYIYEKKDIFLTRMAKRREYLKNMEAVLEKV